jgi:succinate-semialdehyde dehydrogenase/glutarate-semialdehyde dehydrogenase
MILKSINPHDQSIVGELEFSTPDQIKSIVSEARKACESWKEVPAEDRCAYVSKLKDKLIENREKLARLITLEMGKPLAQSLSEVDSELEFISYYADNGPKFLGPEIILQNDKEYYKVTYEPYGVCACICPWNFPLSMVTSGVLPAIIAGNTVVVKPSEYTSLCQKLVVDLINETGLPKGVVNLVIGDSTIGQTLADSGVDLVWFTGSTKAGMDIYRKCGEKFIKALLEMGGSSPAIVLNDANVDNAVENLYWARFLNCGQVCTAVKRLFVQDGIYEKFVDKLVERVKVVKIGNPVDNNDIGPLVNLRQLQVLEEQVKDAIDKGSEMLTGGKRPASEVLKKGNYFEPTILSNVTMDMKIMKEETFGPVLPIIKFESIEEAINMANNTEYGLSAEIYTLDLDKGEALAKKIQTGTVAINTDNFFKPQCPFGGYKKSGMGREYGKIGMQEFAQVKVVAINKV